MQGSFWGPFATAGLCGLVLWASIGADLASAQPSAGTSTLGVQLPSGREGTSAVWISAGRAFVFGGSDGNSVLDEIVRVDPPSSAQAIAVKLPSARTETAAVWTGSVALIFGGKTSTGFVNPIKEIVKFDPGSGTVTTATAKLPLSLAGTAAVWAGDKAYLFGGFSDQGSVVGRIFEYDPVLDQVTTKASQFSDGIAYASAIWNGDEAYIFGGISRGFTEVFNHAWRYKPATDTLVKMSGALPFPVMGGAAAFSGDHAFILGSAKDQQFTASDTILRFDFGTSKADFDEFTLNHATAFPSAVWASGAVLVFGGRDGDTRRAEIQRFVPGSPPGASTTTTTPVTASSPTTENRPPPPVGAAGSIGGNTAVDVVGTIEGPQGASLAGIPLVLLATQDGVLRPVAATVTASDGSYQFTSASQTPEYVIFFDGARLQVRPIASSTQGSPPVEPFTASSAPAAELSDDELTQLYGAVEEARTFAVPELEVGGPTVVETGGYLGLQSVSVAPQASDSGLSLLVVKVGEAEIKGLKYPPGKVLSRFALSLFDDSSPEVPVLQSVLSMVPPEGTNAERPLWVSRYLPETQAWEPYEVTPGGPFQAFFPGLSLFAVYQESPGLLETPYAYVGVVVIGAGLVGAGGWQLTKKLRRRGPKPMRSVPPAAAAAAVAGSVVAVPKSSVALRDQEFLVSDLSFRAGENKLLDKLSFGFHAGQILALLGPSGSGKSTLLKCIIGENQYDGEITVFGYRPRADKDALKRLIGYVSQETQLYADMTVKENLEYFGKQYGIPKAELGTRVKGLMATLGLDERADTPLKVLSGGQQRRASIGATLVQSPALLILDEPTSGLDPITRRNLWKFVRQANRELGVSVIVTTHFLDEAEFADQIVILVRGRLVASGGPEELVKSLPGGGKVAIVELQATSAAVEKKIRDAAAPLIKAGTIKKVDITGYTVRFYVDNPQAANRSLLEMFHTIDVPMKSLTAEDCKMEDVFVHYAGEPWKETVD